ncbi:MAG: SUMF1/EgtB/PvdO family nonheme iron enzyme [Pirellulales bacterium]
MALCLLAAQCQAAEPDEVETPVEFVSQIQPLLETRCLSCHQEKLAEGGLRLDTLSAALQGGDNGPSLVPGKPKESPLFTRTRLAADDEELMPPRRQGGPLPADQVGLLYGWIAQGAHWPEGLKLEPKERIDTGPPSPDNFELVRQLHAIIAQRAEEAADAVPADYTGKIPQTGVDYQMVALRGGEFLMGSPDGEPKRQEIEGPQANVALDPFWIGKYEVTWDEYEPFMITKADRRKNGALLNFDPEKNTLVDAVSQPTKPYIEMSFGMGQKGFPAISMTQHAANKYCQWLSAQTGHFYRLPTEAEWEYACRAGTTTAYSFGDDPAQLGEYAWYYKNSNEKYQEVGLKKPNPWGLYDMHGNVMEWTADEFSPDYFTQVAKSPRNPFLRPLTPYPPTVRGGGWDDDPDKLRSASRRGSEAAWKQQDPQLPKSIWYHTDARWLGFRVVRPVKIPSAEEMYYFWNSTANKN